MNKPQHKTNDQIIADLKKNGTEVLSATGGKYELKEQDQQFMCLTSDHTLACLHGEEFSIRVSSYRDYLARQNVKVRLFRTTANMITRLYNELGGKKETVRVMDSVGATSAAQMDVIRMISDAVAKKASDIHITVHEDYGTVAYRIHGDLFKFQQPPREKAHEYCATIYQSMCDIAEPTYRNQVHQDARMKSEFVAKCGLFGARIASGPTSTGSRMVIRLLYDTGSRIPTIEELGYLPEQIEQFEIMRNHTSGINILSGATGSGKSTTLVSVLDAIISDAAKADHGNTDHGSMEFLGLSVLTVEDPPEYKIHGATQTPLVTLDKTEEMIRRGWANSIKSAMRQDPDIMMIGEIRDPGSAKAAFDAALTGHGVWTTVHVTDAVSIMTRLRGLDVETDRMLDPEIVTGLINQSLVQKLCPHCSIRWEEGKHLMGASARRRVEKYCQLENVRLRGPGCDACNGQGIMGRMVIAEVICPNLGFMDVFAEKGKAKAKDYWVRKMGGITKCMALIRRVNEGFLDPREGESKICPIDHDLVTMGLDYSIEGDFQEGRARIVSHLDEETEFELPATLAAGASMDASAVDSFSKDSADSDPIGQELDSFLSRPLGDSAQLLTI